MKNESLLVIFQLLFAGFFVDTHAQTVKGIVLDVETDEPIPFASSGFFDSKHLHWWGDMADQRIAELLPFEYWPYY